MTFKWFFNIYKEKFNFAASPKKQTNRFMKIHEDREIGSKHISQGLISFPYLMYYGKIQNLPVFPQSATFYTDLYFELKEKKKINCCQ